MTLHQLKIFDAVASHLNITTTSRKIRISQPSVTKQLRLLERECGAKLYVKNGRGIRLTDKGRAFQIAVRPILEQVEDLKETFIEDYAGDASAKALVIGSTPSPAGFFLSAVLKSFVELYPNVHPTLRTGYPPAIKEMVLDCEVEIALTTTFPNHPDIVAEPTYSEEVVAVASAKHPLAKKGKLTEADLRRVPFVMMTGGRIAQEISNLGLKLNVVLWCESIELEKESVQAGLGLGLFYRGSAEAGLKEGYFKLVDIPQLKNIKIPCFVIYKKAKRLSSQGRSLLALLRQWMKDSNGKQSRE
jgi:LysR family transcriptional regulator, low CO2-responsive transcriptional regulator